MDELEKQASKQIGVSVRALRTKLGWSQAVLAERIETSVEYVSFLERGARLPSVGTLMRLSKIFRVPVGVLFGEAAHPPPEEKDPGVALLRSVPDAARPVVLAMLRGVAVSYRKGRRR